MEKTKLLIDECTALRSPLYFKYIYDDILAQRNWLVHSRKGNWKWFITSLVDVIVIIALPYHTMTEITRKTLLGFKKSFFELKLPKSILSSSRCKGDNMGLESPLDAGATLIASILRLVVLCCITTKYVYYSGLAHNRT